jgi:hypothetical protein
MNITITTNARTDEQGERSCVTSGCLSGTSAMAKTVDMVGNRSLRSGGSGTGTAASSVAEREHS